uniref:Exosome complex component 10 n=1 Tax=Callithrix jacchus TaxID=9483 RepID=F6YPY2_CALJA
MAPPNTREPGVLSATSATRSDGEMVLPGFLDADSFVKFALGSVVAVTKASGGLPQFGDEYDFYRSFPGFQAFCETQGDRLLQCMSRVMQYHGCRSNIKDRSKVTELEDKFDLLVDTNDVILERVGILLDEASGVNKNQQPVLPAGLQVPKTIVSSWNRKAAEYGKKAKSETFRLLHAKNIIRPQLKFREKIDNSNTPFLPKIFIKPNAQKPLPQALSKERRERPQDLFAYPQPQLYRPVEETPCHFISSLDELVELNEKLLNCQEFAVDLEHHSYRSFLGLTCLMQISTRMEDFIIDTLELRSDMYILNESLTNPAIVKVFHGADSDIEWLQKDFGLYVVNMFDTHQAARLLNLGRHSLDHLLKLYCNVESNKQYQLADWRIRPLPEEMLSYARDDTHYLLYIYDKMRLELWDRGNSQPVQLQVVWQRSRDIYCNTFRLCKFIKPIFTDESYLELYRKQKKHLNTQQLAAFQLLFAWRDKTARREDESYGYVLPNHMMLKIAEELPKEPQGIIACCNPVPPLVRQQINEMHLLIQQAREMPLLKPAGVFFMQRLENVLFGPHDCSHAPPDGYPIIPTNGSVPVQNQANLFPDEKEDNLLGTTCVIATAVITLFNEPSAEDNKKGPLTVAQKKAQNIMESFENPFRMFLPSLGHRAPVSQAAKFDPSTKIYEISNRWKLAQIQVQKESKETDKKKAAEQTVLSLTAAREQAKEACGAVAEQAISVRQQAALENAAKKRERTTSDPRTPEQKQEKKRLKISKKPKDPGPPEKDFTPYDYSQSDFKAFAGISKSKASSQFDPNKQTLSGKKCIAAKKIKQSLGNKSMSFPTGKSDRYVVDSCVAQGAQ